jgi:hypothetical protein
VLACELIAHPYTTMGIADDGPYILIARNLAATGHIVYNGPTTPFLGWQLYLAAAFIKLFGFSFTAVRMSTLLAALVMAFLLQRTLVRCGITERNATIATLALVLSPLYLVLSVTFMTDIFGLFGLLICLYGCLRALQSPSSRAAIGWLCFAVLTNAIFGSSRQVSWFGILVMVPSTLWLLRSRRTVLLAGALADLAGVAFILACMVWFSHQPYNVHEGLVPSHFSLQNVLWQCLRAFFDAPFLLLPIAAVFLPQLRKLRPPVLAIVLTAFLAYLLLAFHWRHAHPDILLEPTQLNAVTSRGSFEVFVDKGSAPLFLNTPIRFLLTILSLGGLLGLIASLVNSRKTPTTAPPTTAISWPHLATLLAPFSIAYLLILVPRAGFTGINDRYLLQLLLVALICLVRYYQEQIAPRLGLVPIVLVAALAIYGTAVTHNLFAFYRARVALAAELHAAGIPDTSIDNDGEQNMVVELQHSPFINDSRMSLPAHAYRRVPPLPPGTCKVRFYDQTPHIIPIYGISFDPNACYGPAPFSPVHYFRWLASPGTLYMVRYVPPPKP